MEAAVSPDGSFSSGQAMAKGYAYAVRSWAKGGNDSSAYSDVIYLNAE